MPLRTVIYLRKSSQDKDEKQIHSIPRQKSDILDFIDKYNKVHPPEERLVYEEGDVIEEDASAKKLGRHKFDQMIKAIQKNKYDVLLCTELSRLSRNAVDTGTLVQLLEYEDDKKPHLKRIQTKDKTFSITPTDKFTLALFLTVSKFENDQRALNTQSGMAHRKSQGATTHRAPIGYINVGEKKGDKWVEPDPETWDSIRHVWELFMTGDYSIPDLKREGDALGITVLQSSGRRSLPAPTTYRGMLCNRYYAGYVKKVDKEHGVVEWKEGKHQALVTMEEFERVQLILQSRGYKHQPTERAPSIDALLNEILICGKCDTEVNGLRRPTRMVFEDKTRYTCPHCRHRFSSASKKPCPKCGEHIPDSIEPDIHRYYHCGKRHSAQVCAHDFYGTGKKTKNVKAEDVEKFLDQQLSSLHISDDLFDLFRRQLYTLWLNNNESIKKQKANYRKELKKLEDERIAIQRKGLDRANMSDIEREDYENLLDRNKSDQIEIEGLIESLKDDEEEQFEKAWQSLQAMKDANTVFGSAAIGFEPKRRLILSLVSNLKITDDNWEVIWKKPFAELANSDIAKMSKNMRAHSSDADKFNWLPRLDSNQ